VLLGAMAAGLAGLAWTLLRPVDGLVVRLAAAAMFLVVGAQLWAERPFMIGLLCLAAIALAMEGRLDPRWLVPIGWIWVNSHGSFPLGLVLLVVAAIGSRLDGRTDATELRCLPWAAGGMLLGAVGPLGVRVLVFPLELLQRQDVLANVIEWRAPAFDTVGQRVFIAQIALSIVAIARRPSYRAALVVAVFTAAALLGARNLVVASLVFLPVTAPALAGLGSLTTSARPRLARLAGAAGVATLVLLTAARFDQRPMDLDSYPIGPLAYLEEAEVDTREVRLATPDVVGNLLGYIYGPQGRAFYDDRFDMFPDEVSAAHVALIQAKPSLRGDLEELEIDLVTTPRGSPTAQLLALDPVWRTIYLDDDWVLLCHREADLGGTAGRC
jgi:hypothetical protein